jgi:hypothetical protein
MNRAAKNYLVAAGFTAVAAAAGLVLQVQLCVHLSPVVYGAASLCAFTLGTVGRLGFHDMTWGGVSSHEKLDFRLFLFFYFIGLATGIAALKAEPTSQNAANKTLVPTAGAAVSQMSSVALTRHPVSMCHPAPAVGTA